MSETDWPPPPLPRLTLCDARCVSTPPGVGDEITVEKGGTKEDMRYMLDLEEEEEEEKGLFKANAVK